MTEFTENINESAEIKYNFFFTNFEYESRMKFNITKIFNSQSIQKRIDQSRVQIMLRQIKQI